MSGLRCLGVLLCYNDGDLLDLLPRFTSHDAALTKKILVENPARLYGFPNE